MKKKNDWIGFTLLPAGVASLFLGLGSFNRDSTVMALILIGVGAALLGIAWRALKEPAHASELENTSEPTKIAVARRPATESVDVSDRRNAAE